MKLTSFFFAMLLSGACVAAEEPRPKDERDEVTRYHAFHVLVPNEDAAKKARARIVTDTKGNKKRTLQALNGVAREASADKETAPRGGDLGRVLEGTFEERFEKAVLALEPGALSAPFESEYGWHVVYLAEKRAIPVSLLCGAAQALEAGDVARITVELGPAWRGPAADLKGTVSFLRAESSERGPGLREATLHRELPHAVLVPARDPPACYRSMRTRFVVDCGRERLAGLSEEYFDERAAKGNVVDAIVEKKKTLDDADFETVPARGGARQIYDEVCQSRPDVW